MSMLRATVAISVVIMSVPFKAAESPDAHPAGWATEGCALVADVVHNPFNIPLVLQANLSDQISGMIGHDRWVVDQHHLEGTHLLAFHFHFDRDGSPVNFVEVTHFNSFPSVIARCPIIHSHRHDASR
jgi:hypothetical protein